MNSTQVLWDKTLIYYINSFPFVESPRQVLENSIETPLYTLSVKNAIASVLANT